jgi:hypothetical protein
LHGTSYFLDKTGARDGGARVDKMC